MPPKPRNLAVNVLWGRPAGRSVHPHQHTQGFQQCSRSHLPQPWTCKSLSLTVLPDTSLNTPPFCVNETAKGSWRQEGRRQAWLEGDPLKKWNISPCLKWAKSANTLRLAGVPSCTLPSTWVSRLRGPVVGLFALQPDRAQLCYCFHYYYYYFSSRGFEGLSTQTQTLGNHKTTAYRLQSPLGSSWIDVDLAHSLYLGSRTRDA